MVSDRELVLECYLALLEAVQTYFVAHGVSEDLSINRATTKALRGLLAARGYDLFIQDGYNIKMSKAEFVDAVDAMSVSGI